MGVVYLARNRLMGRDEALKVLGPSIANRPEILERFKNEIRALVRLQHPNIVTAYSAFPCGESIAFAMEYIEGHDLGYVVRSRGSLPVVLACFSIHQVALALGHAHEQGQVHRDVKPDNLMLSEAGGRPNIKVLNFGLAKVFVECQMLDFRSRVGSDARQTIRPTTAACPIPGTLEFIAPEQIIDPSKADIRADIYSLGCTFYYLLSGRPPFSAASSCDVLQAHHSMNARLLNLVRPEVPIELAALVAKMMAKEPDQRFQTPDEVARALLPFFRRRPVFEYVANPGCVLDEASVPGRSLIEDGQRETRTSPRSALNRNPDDPGTVNAKAIESSADSVRSPGRRRAFRLAVFTSAGVMGLLGALLLLPKTRDRSRLELPLPKVPSIGRTEPEPSEEPSLEIPGIFDPGTEKPETPKIPTAESTTVRSVPLEVSELPYPPFAPFVPEPANPPVRDPSEGLTWRDSLCVARSEQDARAAAEQVEARSGELRLAKKELQDGQVREDAEAVLSQQRETLLREQDDLRIRWQQLNDQANVKRRQWDMLDEAGGPNDSQTQDLKNSLRREINTLNYQALFLKQGAEQREDRRKTLTSEIERIREEAGRRKPIRRLQTKVEERRDAYDHALRNLRDQVELTKRDYDELSRDPKVTALIDSKNLGLARPRYKLGPSPWFLNIENKLKRLKEPAIHEPPARGGRATRKTTSRPAAG